MILEDIVESTKERVETNKKRHSIYELKEKAFAMPIDQSFPFKKALEKEGIKMANAEVTMIPQNYVTLTDEEAIKKMNIIIDRLDEDEDVQQVYHNWDE